jgi:hypothetical protein
MTGIVASMSHPATSLLHEFLSKAIPPPPPSLPSVMLK